jgi:hypothetical protein
MSDNAVQRNESLIADQDHLQTEQAVQRLFRKLSKLCK